MIKEDAAGAQAFVDTWTPRVEAVTHARNRTMLRVVLGETAIAFDVAKSDEDELCAVAVQRGADAPGRLITTAS